MALAADRITKSKGGTPRRQTYLVAASTTIYAGAMVCIDASGYAVPASNTAGLTDVKGIAVAQVVNAGSAGDKAVVVEYGVAYLIDVGAGITQADVGRGAFVTDDQTATDDAAASNDIYIGEILEYLNEAQDKAWINVLANRAAAVPVGSIATADLADLSVTTAKLAVGVISADAAGRALFAAGVLDAATALSAFGADSIANAFLIDAIADGAFQADAASRALFANAFLTKAKSLSFFSTEVTCTGSAQDVAHGLGATPAGVIIAPTELVADLAAGYDCAEGAHDATNITFTATSTAKVKIFAWA